MIIVNGLPKSGTHAVMAWLTQLGLKRIPGTILADPELRAVGRDLASVRHENRPRRFILAHVPASHELWGNVITVFRDPRNVLVSYCRHREREDGYKPPLADAIGDFWGRPFVPAYEAYLGWRGRSVVIHYEDMPPEQTGEGAELYAGESRDWNTRTGRPSDWRDHWDWETDVAWRRAGGPALLRRAGYARELLRCAA